MIATANTTPKRAPLSLDPDQRFCELMERYIEDNAGDIASDFSDADSDEKLLKAARHLRESMVEYAKEKSVPFHMR